jgi:hypothetical protein
MESNNWNGLIVSHITLHGTSARITLAGAR